MLRKLQFSCLNLSCHVIHSGANDWPFSGLAGLTNRRNNAFSLRRGSEVNWFFLGWHEKKKAQE